MKAGHGISLIRVAQRSGSASHQEHIWVLLPTCPHPTAKSHISPYLPQSTQCAPHRRRGALWCAFYDLEINRDSSGSKVAVTLSQAGVTSAHRVRGAFTTSAPLKKSNDNQQDDAPLVRCFVYCLKRFCPSSRSCCSLSQETKPKTSTHKGFSQHDIEQHTIFNKL